VIASVVVRAARENARNLDRPGDVRDETRSR
jgi:hypothetical protein